MKKIQTFNQTFSKTESVLCFSGIVATSKAYFENDSSASWLMLIFGFKRYSKDTRTYFSIFS